MPIESWHAALDTNLNDTFLHAQRFARSYAPRVRAGVAWSSTWPRPLPFCPVSVPVT